MSDQDVSPPNQPQQAPQAPPQDNPPPNPWGFQRGAFPGTLTQLAQAAMPGAPAPSFIPTPAITGKPASQFGRPNADTQAAQDAASADPTQGPLGGAGMPQPQDIPGMVHRIATGFGRYGSPSVAGSAIGAGMGATGYWKAFAEGQEARQKLDLGNMEKAHLQMQMAHEQYEEGMKQTADRQHKEFQDLTNALNIFGVDPSDPSSAARVHQAYEYYVHQHPEDHVIQNYWAQGGPASAEALFNYRDGLMQDVDKIILQQELQRHKYDGDRDAVGLPKEGGDKTTEPETTKPSTAKPDTTKTDEPADPNKPQTPTSVAANDDAIVRSLGGSNQVSPAMMQMAHSLANGGNPNTDSDLDTYKNLDKNSPVKHRIDDAVRAINAQIDRIAFDKRYKTVEDKLKAMEAIDPGSADTMRGVLAYDINPKDLGTANRRGMFVKRAHAIDPGYNENNYAAASKYTLQNSPEFKELQTFGQEIQSATTVYGALKRLPEDEAGLKRRFDAWKKNNFTGDDEMAQLYGALRQFANNAQAVSSGVGTPRVSLVNNMLAHMDIYNSPRQIRVQIMADLQDGYARFAGAQGEWSRLTGKKTLVPGMSKSRYEALSAYLRSNPHTGKFDDRAPPELKATEPRTTSARLTPEEQIKPITRERWKQYHDYITANINNNNPEVQARVRKAEELTGYVIDQEMDIDLEHSQ